MVGYIFFLIQEVGVWVQTQNVSSISPPMIILTGILKSRRVTVVEQFTLMSQQVRTFFREIVAYIHLSLIVDAKNRKLSILTL